MSETQPKNRETSTEETEVFSQYELPPIPPAEGALANVGGNTIVSSGNLQSSNYSPNGSSGFIMQPNGDAVFNNLTATGRITFSDGGVVGGFEFGDDYIRDTGNSFGMSSAVTGGDDIRFWAGSTLANFATAPFRLTESGFFYGSNVDVTGTVTSNAGAIAGWTLAVGELSSTNNKIKLQSTNERILVGNATAPLTGTGVFIGKDGTDYEFRVGDPTGKYIHFDGVTGFTMNGMYISQAVLASIAAGSELSIQNWQFDGVFSATSGTVVSWTTGTFRFANETTTYTISAGNTSTMSGLTYIYFDVNFPTVLKVTATASTAVGAGKILVAVAQNGTTEATFQAYGGTGGLNIDGSRVTPGSIGVTEADINLQNWTTNIAFSVAVTTTPQQVNWGAGSIYVNSTTYSISAGNTGTMTARTYIYLNPAVSTTVLQTTPTLANAIGNGKLLIATATASATTVATFNVLGGIGGFRGGSSSIPTAANSWNFSGGFAASASNVVYWGAGNFRTSDGNVFSITGSTTTAACTAAGLPSPMAGRLYIYFDLLAPSTFKVGQYIADALGDGKIYVGTCAPGTTEASFLLFSGSGSINIDGANIAARSITANEITANTITANEIAAVTITAAQIVAGTITTTQIAANTIVAGNIAAGTITTTQIAANTIVAGNIAAGTITTTQIAAGTILASNIAAGTITADRLVANSITAGYLNVTTLSSIAANMGTITAGTITFTAAGHLKGGQSAYNSGTGFFLGYESSAYKFSVGDPTNNKYLTFDGTDVIANNVKLVHTFVAGETATVDVPTPVYINTLSTLAESLDASCATNTTYTSIYDNAWGAQTFKLGTTKNTITKVTVYIAKTGSPAGNVTASIYATSGGVPTGSALGSQSITASTIGAASDVTFSFSTPVTCIPGYTYALVLSVPSGDSSNRIDWYYAGSGDNYAYGNRFTSTTSGSAWTDTGAALDFQFGVYSSYVQGAVPGEVMLCDDTSAAKLSYTGMASSSLTDGSNINIQMTGLVDGYTKLSIGSTYYINGSLDIVSQTTQNNSFQFGYSAAYEKVGQTFLYDKYAGRNKLDTITVKLQKFGTPTDNLVIKLYASDKTTLLATSTVKDGSTIASGSMNAYTFTFPTPYTMVYGTTYFFEISRSGANSTGNYWQIADNTAGGYSGGSDFLYASGSWTDLTYDLYMVLNIDPVIYTTAGTNSVKVGRAVSATQLLIYQLAI